MRRSKLFSWLLNNLLRLLPNRKLFSKLLNNCPCRLLKDRVTVQYALESSSLPIGVSDYVLERFIPADFKSQLPTIEEVEGELTRRMEISEERRLGK